MVVDNNRVKNIEDLCAQADILEFDEIFTRDFDSADSHLHGYNEEV
jgi:hypothetical protein